MKFYAWLNGMLVLGLSIGVMSCGEDDNGNQAPGSTPSAGSVEGLNFTGTYDSDGLICYSADGTATATAEVEDYSVTVTIAGNEYTAVSESGDCTSTTTGHVVFNNAGAVLLTDGKISVPGGGSCAYNPSITPTPAGSITPATASFTETDGEAVEAVPSAYKVIAEDMIGIASTFQSSNPGDTCYLTYIKD